MKITGYQGNHHHFSPFVLKNLFLILIFSFGINLCSQDFEWVKFYQGQSTQMPVSMSVDQKGNQYATFNYSVEIKFDATTYSTGTIYTQAMVLKQDTKGKHLWHRFVRTNNTVTALSSMFNSKGNCVVFITCPSNIIIGTDTVKRQGSGNYAVYLLEFNDTGKLVYSRHLLEGNLASTIYVSNRITMDQSDNIYMGLTYNGNVKIYDTIGTTTLSSTGNRNIIMKFARSGRQFLWSRNLPTTSGINLNSLKVDKQGHTYVATYWNGTGSFTFKGSSISNPKVATGTMFVLDKNGNDRAWWYVEGAGGSSSSGGLSTIYDLAAEDSNTIWISGQLLGDSFRFDNKWIKRQPSGGAYNYFAKFNIDGKLDWAKVEDTAYFNSFYIYNYYSSMTHYLGEYAYISTYCPNNYWDPVRYDGQRYSAGIKAYAFNMKVDKRGNILWGYKTFFPFIGMGTDANDNFYFQGWWSSDTIKFGKFKAYPNGWDAFIGKTYDYAIFRGSVRKGPYCAGDTLLIPYTRRGNFADTNTFIAELSDEFGNFTGKERILGKVKTNKDSTIIGILPMFQVASSQKYRIRIRSTSPQAQSFYKEDTLRLLIYSRDKANPGPPETICRGDTFMLNTYGGTKWTWSPKVRMDDSTKRQPLIWPQKTSTYKIIIDDSSGCGQPDTAYKKIIVRADPKVHITSPKGILACMNGPANIMAKFENGDSTNYNWRWYYVDKSNAWTLQEKGRHQWSDTFKFMMPPGVKDSAKVAVIFTDSCSPVPDTAFYMVKVKQARPDAVLGIKDTSICPGTKFRLPASFSGSGSGNPNAYSWQWMEKVNTSFPELLEKDSGNSLDTFNAQLNANDINGKQIILVLRDNCSPVEDTVFMTIKPRPALLLNPRIRDTLLCKGNSIQWKVIGTGGVPSAYKINWYAGNKLINTGDKLNITADTGTSFRVVLTDGCMPKNDTVAFSLKVRDSLHAEVWNTKRKQKDTILCYGRNLSVHALSVGGSNTHKFQWLWNDQQVSAIDSFAFKSENVQSSSGTSIVSGILKLVLSDGCTVLNDTTAIKIDVLPPLNVKGIAPDSLCYGMKRWETASARGGNGKYVFTWFNASHNALATNDSNQLVHLLPGNPGSHTTYVVLEDGCTLYPDTATLSTYYIPRPLLSLNRHDTSVCKGNAISYSAIGKGGSPLQYQYRWINNSGVLSNTNKLDLLCDSSMLISAVLSDGCSLFNDTMTFKVKVRPSLRVKVTSGTSPATDTVVCYGQRIRWVASGSGGDTNKYSYSWTWDNAPAGTDSIFSMKQTGFTGIANISYSNTDTGLHKVSVILTDHCSNRNDTLHFKVSILPPLKVSAFAPDTLCYGSAGRLKSKAIGGTGKYTFKWANPADNIVSNADSYKLINTVPAVPGTAKYYVVLGDGCSVKPDTAYTNTILLAPLKLSIKASDSCVTSSTVLTPSGLGGKPYGYYTTWFADGQSIGATTGTLPVTLQHNTIYKAVLHDGCSNTSDTVSVQVGIIPQGSLLASPLEGCEPLRVTLNLRMNYTSPFSWDLDFGDGKIAKNLQNKDSVQLHVYGNGLLSASATVTTALGCKNTFRSPAILVHPKPVSYYAWSPEVPTLDEPLVTFNNRSTGAKTYLWNFDKLGSSTDTDPLFAFKDTGTYNVVLIATSDKGCSDTFKALIKVRANYKIFIPTAFSPDANGVNETWIPFTSGIIYMRYTLWSRWGEKVFDGDHNTPWNGKYQGTIVPEGVYLYMIEVKNQFGAVEYLRGTITVLR